MTRDELIRALEEATGPDRELDAEIAVTAVGWCLHKNTRYTGYQDDTGFDCLDCGADSWGNRSKNGLNQRLHDKPPAYTASLDAALSLAGDRWLPVLLSAIASLVGWLAEPRDKNGHLMRRLTMNVCAAALRAQEAAP